MIKFWYIGDHGDFFSSRSGRIGASDVPACIMSPEKMGESLAGFGSTALTVYQEKIGEKEREPAGLSAEMGHFLENKALELFIRRFSGIPCSADFVNNKMTYEMIRKIGNIAEAETYQNDLYKHNTQYYVDGMIAHPDCVYIGDESLKGKKERFVTKHGVKVDLSKPFLIEAKSATAYSAKRPEGSLIRGYDTKLSTYQGIPLKHYMQIQFQLALFQIDVAYLALIHNTSEFHVWRIDANRKIQGQIMDIVGKMVKCIQTKTPPRELAMNEDDVKYLYKKPVKDFIMLSGERLEKTMEACKEWLKADRQEKIWKARKTDAKNALAVRLGDFEEIRDGSDVLAKWQIRKGNEKISINAGTCKKEDPTTYKYLKKKGYVKEGSGSRFGSVKWRGEE